MLSLTDHLHRTCHTVTHSFCCRCFFSMQERCHFFPHLDSVIIHMCTHTCAQSGPINIFHRAFHTKLIMRNRCHYQHRTTVLTALQTDLRHRHREMNDRTRFVDDPRNLFYSTAHICALYHLILCSRYFQKVAHKLHYRCASCSCKHVLVGRKHWGTREWAGWSEAGWN